MHIAKFCPGGARMVSGLTCPRFDRRGPSVGALHSGMALQIENVDRPFPDAAACQIQPHVCCMAKNRPATCPVLNRRRQPNATFAHRTEPPLRVRLIGAI